MQDLTPHHPAVGDRLDDAAPKRLAEEPGVGRKRAEAFLGHRPLGIEVEDDEVRACADLDPRLVE